MTSHTGTQQGSAVVAFVAGMAAASLFFIVSYGMISTRRTDEAEEQHKELKQNGEMKRKRGGSTAGSTVPGKHRWPWDSRTKSTRSSSTESESSYSSTSASPRNSTASRETSNTSSSTTSAILVNEDALAPPLQATADTTCNAANTNRTTKMAQQKSKQDNLCIGSIFGLDVGGTLAKLVYFEAEDHTAATAAAASSSPSSSSPSESYTKKDESARQALLKKRASMTKVSSSRKDWKPLLVAQDHYQHLHFPHTNSVPSKLNTLGGGENHESHPPLASTSYKLLRRTLSSSLHNELLEHLDHKYSTESQTNNNKQYRHREALARFYAVAKTLAARHDNVSFYSSELGGTFHFIQFETKHMTDAMELIRHYNLHMNIHEMGGTGGGAHKYAELWKNELAIEMKKLNELDSLVAGMQFVLNTVVGECYTYRPHNDQTKVDDWSQKFVQRHEDDQASSLLYPYLVVIIGTGVSVLRVDGPRQYERVSGSTIGGGTFFGLIRLLTDADMFDDGLKLAERGDPSKIDMLVGDIYGANSDALEKIGLPADLVASSFGKLVAKDDPASGLNQEDISRALLLMITNNIGQVAHLNAKLHKTKRIYFVGNFLRHNEISQRRLSYAINYWSKGEEEALFLKHEGYFGALGAFLLSQRISVSGSGIRQWKNQMPHR